MESETPTETQVVVEKEEKEVKRQTKPYVYDPDMPSKLLKADGSIQSVIFDNKIFNSTEARRILKSKGLKPIKRVDKTKSLLRYRITDPSLYKSYETVNSEIDGLRYIVGH